MRTLFTTINGFLEDMYLNIEILLRFDFSSRWDKTTYPTEQAIGGLIKTQEAIRRTWITPPTEVYVETLVCSDFVSIEFVANDFGYRYKVPLNIHWYFWIFRRWNTRDYRFLVKFMDLKDLLSEQYKNRVTTVLQKPFDVYGNTYKDPVLVLDADYTDISTNYI